MTFSSDQVRRTPLSLFSLPSSSYFGLSELVSSAFTELLYGTVDLVVPSEYNFMNPAVSSLPDLNAQLSHHPSSSSRHHPFSTSTGSTRPPSPSLYGSNSNPSANEPPRPDFGEAPSGLLAGLALAPGDPSLKRVERKPEGLKIVFLLDVSWNAGKSGMIGEWCEGVRKTLYGEEGAVGGGDEGSEGSSLVVVGGDETGAVGAGCRLAEGTQVAFMTFDRAVHFYDFTVSPVPRAQGGEGRGGGESRVRLPS